MIAKEDVALAHEWLQDNCPRAHIRATLDKGLAFVDALEKAGLPVENIQGKDLYAFLAAAAGTRAYHEHFMQPDF